MSSTKFWDVQDGTTTRRQTDGSPTQGSGGSHRLYVGRHGSYDYQSYLKFELDWTDVGRIVSATLILYSDDGGGLFPLQTTDTPKMVIRRLTGAFTEGGAADTAWESDDYTNPSRTTSDQVYAYPSRAADELNRFNITAIVEDWAPSTVKRRSGTAGGASASSNKGIVLKGYPEATRNVAFYSENYATAGLRPQIELVYELGPTTPTAPTNMTPTGSVTSLSSFQGDFADPRASDELRYSTVQVYDAGVSGTAATDNNITKSAHGLKVGDQIYFTSLTGGAGLSTFTRYYVRVVASSSAFRVSTTPTGDSVDITDDYSALTYSKLLYSRRQAASATEITNDRFDHVPDPVYWAKAGVTYRWRARTQDQEGEVSAYSSLVSFSISNTAPSTPTLTPSSGTYDTLDGVLFRGSAIVDSNNDRLLAYQVQMAETPESGIPDWDDAANIVWDTGKTYVALGATAFSIPYGGSALEEGFYTWRARYWDRRDGVSEWGEGLINITNGFEPDPELASQRIQTRPRAPWRIVIKGMGALRGPGDVVAILENAKSTGASILYNSPGELHFTLPVDHPKLAVIEPKQTHYAVEFYTGDGWREKYAGLMWDFDANERDIVFYGIDYLALYDYVMDERYDPSKPNLPAEKGGSYYVTEGKNSLGYIVHDQLTKAKALANSPVGFITINQSSATLAAMMPAKVAIYSTMQPVLQFVTGLLESHRGGGDKRTRIQVRRKSAGGYEVVIQNAPGEVRDNLRFKYGELVQGYRVIPFGQDWATRVNTIGRSREGVKVMYQKAVSGLDEAVWGRFARAALVNDVSDANDLLRRTKQMAIVGGKLGKQIGLGIRTGVLGPRDGYDVTDIFPISIEHGSISTEAFGSGYWVCVGITWEASDLGQQNVTLTFRPREDGVDPSGDLLLQQDLSTQKEWQVGWTAPDAINASSLYWLDQTTGIVYKRDETGTATSISGTA